MSVRKIPKNYLYVTGGYSSRKNDEMGAFESLLEKDYLLLLDFDERVEAFEVQPVRIPVAGIPSGYVPDVLVKYHADVQTEPPRILRRLQPLRRWSHEEDNEVLPGSTRTRRADGI
jgi:hypothetical protein